MNRKSVLLALTAALVLSVLVATLTAQSKDVLAAGNYTAKVKAIVCGGCGPLIQKTMQALPEIDMVKVDQEKKTVQFAVKKGATLKLTELQKALDAAANKMGMGADYTLSDLQAAK